MKNLEDIQKIIEDIDFLAIEFVSNSLPYWTTAKGKKIKYSDLTDSHLQNILRDGYRNTQLIKEAKKRNIRVPIRAIDELSFAELMSWIESISSCALSGNAFAEEMSKLYKENKFLFYLKLNSLITLNKKKT